jgi:hypothetical protein
MGLASESFFVFWKYHDCHRRHIQDEGIERHVNWYNMSEKKSQEISQRQVTNLNRKQRNVSIVFLRTVTLSCKPIKYI